MKKKTKKKLVKPPLFKTPEDALIWFITPSPYWFEISPFIWCIMQKHEEVIKFLKERSGKK